MSYVGPNHQAYDMRQYYDFVDLRGKAKSGYGYPSSELSSVPDNTIAGIIYKTKDFSRFAKIVKISGFEGLLSDPQANITLFVPSDSYLNKKYSPDFFDKIDRGAAAKIVRFSTMNRMIDKKLLQSSPSSYYPTRDRSHGLFVTNNYETILQGCTRVIHWNYKVDNGLIHVVDNLLYFEDMPSVPYY